MAKELTTRGYKVGADTVGSLLEKLGYNLQANRKTLEGASHPDRNAQFEYIEALSREFLESGQPVISVDTKKKELVGEYKNGGREYHPKGSPERVKTHDFPDRASVVLSHNSQLARAAAGKPRGDRELDLQHEDRKGSESRGAA